MALVSVSQVAYLVASQVATKAVTFLSNQLLLRQLSPEIFGIAAFLEFFTNSVLFFSREAVRISCQRASSEKVVVKFAFLPLIICGPILLVLLFLQTYSDLYKNTVSQLPYFGTISALILALILLELGAEPWFAVNQHRFNFKLRSKVESVAVFLKCIAIFTLVTYFKRFGESAVLTIGLFRGQAVLSFVLGQFVYSSAIFLGYWIGTKPSANLVETHPDDESFSDKRLVSVWQLLFLQMSFKHLLTEGDTMLVSYLFTVSQQGVYSVIANYGSIIARLLFQPIEELIRVSFTRSLAQKSPEFTSAYKTMSQLLTFYFNLSLLIVVGGYTNGPFLLRILLGRNEKWSQSSVFSDFPVYVLYIPFMAFNGVLEAFFSSASNQVQIGNFSIFMSILSCIVFALMYVFIGKFRWGIAGLILANMANMSLRITYCLVFFVRFFKTHVVIDLKSVTKKAAIPVSLAISALVLQRFLFPNGVTTNSIEFAQSMAICLVCLLGMLMNEKSQLMQLKVMMQKRQKQN